MTDYNAYSLQELQELRNSISEEIADARDNEPNNSYTIDCLIIERNQVDDAIWDRTH
jgi:hypothetical protein